MLRMKAERLRLGLTQQALGYHAHISAADISRFEGGWARPYLGQARRLAEVVGLCENELLEDADNWEGSHVRA